LIAAACLIFFAEFLVRADFQRRFWQVFELAADDRIDLFANVVIAFVSVVR
jgi:hypothetical protein